MKKKNIFSDPEFNDYYGKPIPQVGDTFDWQIHQQTILPETVLFRLDSGKIGSPVFQMVPEFPPVRETKGFRNAQLRYSPPTKTIRLKIVAIVGIITKNRPIEWAKT